MSRGALARIDLAALGHNYALLRRLHGGRALAVLKANAYGHGAIECARALVSGQTPADGFAVAFLDEALQLRDAGISQPILLLEGVFDSAELQQAMAQRLWLVVHHEAQLRCLEEAAVHAGQAIDVWLKINTGMSRVGFAPHEVAAVYARLMACPHVRAVTFMTHFARADEPDAEATHAQIQRFDAAVKGLPGAHSLCNSAGVLAWPQARRDWARPGIAIYGAEPFADAGHSHGLQPVMSLHSQVFAERTLAEGEALGYGGTFVATRPTRVGIVALGYADGYPRCAGTGTPVAVDGQPARLLGRVSMDMLMVDLTDVPAAGIGSVVELWGKQVDINRVAQAAGTIAYELLCNVKRVARAYGPLDAEGV